MTLDDGASGRARIIYQGSLGQTINSSINGNTGGEGSLIIRNNAGVTISTAIGGGTGLRDMTLEFGGDVTANAAVNATDINIGTLSELEANAAINGNVNFTGDGRFELGDNVGFSNAIDNQTGSDGAGSLTSASAGASVSFVTGTVGDTLSIRHYIVQ